MRDHKAPKGPHIRHTFLSDEEQRLEDFAAGVSWVNDAYVDASLPPYLDEELEKWVLVIYERVDHDDDAVVVEPQHI